MTAPQGVAGHNVERMLEDALPVQIRKHRERIQALVAEMGTERESLLRKEALFAVLGKQVTAAGDVVESSSPPAEEGTDWGISGALTKFRKLG